jgi:hypothetical protein
MVVVFKFAAVLTQLLIGPTTSLAKEAVWGNVRQYEAVPQEMSHHTFAQL